MNKTLTFLVQEVNPWQATRQFHLKMGFSLTGKSTQNPWFRLEIPNLGTVDGWNPAPPRMYETL